MCVHIGKTVIVTVSITTTEFCCDVLLFTLNFDKDISQLSCFHESFHSFSLGFSSQCVL